VAALISAAPAKVNLSLHVTGRRADGYHLLDSLVVFANVGDVVAAAPADDVSLTIEGPFAGALAHDPDNLVLRAARLLADHAGVPARAALTLTKNLPVASGIGGGSADAAATLRVLCRLWDVSPDPAELRALGQRLGADVPVCLEGRPVRMRGTGEILDPVPDLPPAGLLLVNPGVPLATADVFRARQAPFSVAPGLPSRWPDAASLAGWLSNAANDLEPPARALRPEVAAALQAISGADLCLLARMSGSGATCFGLFPDGDAASRAAQRLARPGWWCWGGAL
jgi:4-diphosphocytidyl-2-C-methyl-D-erythritol kinase